MAPGCVAALLAPTEALQAGACCDSSGQHSSLTTCAVVAATASFVLQSHYHYQLTLTGPVKSSLVTTCGQQC